MNGGGNGIEKRIGELEQELVGVKTRLLGLDGAFIELTRKLETANSKIEQSQKTPWGTIFGAFSLFLVIAGFLGNLYSSDIADLKGTLGVVEQRTLRQVSPAEYREDYRELERRIDIITTKQAEAGRTIAEFERLRDHLGKAP